MGGKSSKSKQKKKDLLDDWYVKSDLLGQGSFGAVYKGIKVPKQQKNKIPDTVAIKCISKTNMKIKELSMLDNEIKIMKSLDHEGIVKLLKTFDTEAELYLCMEYMPQGELFEKICELGKFSEEEAKVCIKQVASALAYSHSCGVVHRDLKPENLLLGPTGDYFSVKISDFGLSKLIDDPEKTMETCCGTPEYVAPEIIDRRAYDKKCDCWSLGIVLYILLSGCLPFYSENKALMYKMIKRGKYQMPESLWEGVGEPARDLVKKLLVVDPKRRLSCEEVLKHPFITGRNSTRCRPQVVLDGIKSIARKKWRLAKNTMTAVMAFNKEGSRRRLILEAVAASQRKEMLANKLDAIPEVAEANSTTSHVTSSQEDDDESAVKIAEGNNVVIIGSETEDKMKTEEVENVELSTGDIELDIDDKVEENIEEPKEVTKEESTKELTKDVTKEESTKEVTREEESNEIDGEKKRNEASTEELLPSGTIVG
eukprot:TRINITY_DN1169_c0_g4_i3.p1 TRINITY_DN1169_c0_g4~~TRINITY_DN1169_c0_g4_i3.p1  ORF type:complete len:483 (+),score=168.21 TRINITY_DN1169_c0_g4_i3:106-1554(+)